jgi:ribulose-phosphate 3-epimerase
MLSKSIIIPSILTTSSEEMAKRLKFTQTTSQSVHLDVIDSEFCEGRTLQPDDWPDIKVNYSEVHLMVKRPLELLPVLAKKKITRAIIHIESNFELGALKSRAKELDLLLGWAVNPDTDLDRLRALYNVSSYIQVMGVDPGHSDQKMISTTPLAVAYLKRIPSRRLTVSVDGGVSLETIEILEKVGASYFVASHAIFSGGDWSANYQALLNAHNGKKAKVKS